MKLQGFKKKASLNSNVLAVGSAANGAVITSYTPRSNENYAKGV